MGREILIATISTAVPFLTILIGMFVNNKQFSAMDRRFEAMDRRLDAVDRRFDAFERRMDDQFSEIKASLAAVNADLRQFYHLEGILEGKVAALEKRFS